VIYTLVILIVQLLVTIKIIKDEGTCTKIIYIYIYIYNIVGMTIPKNVEMKWLYCHIHFTCFCRKLNENHY